MTEDKKKKEMPFLDHLEELRFRLIKSIVAVFIFAIAAFFLSDYIFEFLQYPLHKALPDIQLHFFGVTEAFLLRIKLAVLCGIFGAMPVLLYQLWQFVVPGLFDNERQVAFPLVFIATIFFLMGASFCFFIVARYGLEFLISTNLPPNTEPVIGLGAYYSFVMWMIIAFGAVFELPVITFFLGRLGIVNSKLLARGRRYAIIAILIVSSLITPPDVFTQISLCIPLYLLYELSIIVVRITGKREEPEKQ
ncbi:MAG: twin-arginine translocase subunit TatC [candidate division Zixibacteria bacterium]|nr:twin-arginine translocase subunit TatC [candidate division Zixibacteria bacterium]